MFIYTKRKKIINDLNEGRKETIAFESVNNNVKLSLNDENV
jgi:hypothetical protein